MSAKNYLAILKAGSLISFFCVFFVFRGLLFPYISSKQIPFDILIEILFVIWLAFIIKYPSYNPFQKKTKNLITYGLIAFFLSMITSLIATVDLNLSLFGDVERMLGAFEIAHFFVLYLIIITVFRSWRDWNILLVTVVAISTVVAFFGIFVDPRISTIGNAAYVAALMLFIFYFIFLLIFHKNDETEKINPWRYLYLLILPFLFWVLSKDNISGAYIGLASSILFFFFLFGITHKKKTAKIIAWGILIFSIVILTLIFSNQQSAFFKNNQALKGISFSKNTFQTRLLSWESAAKDFPHHWLLGTGQGNYAITFDKYFNPKFYNFSTTETYFDHAHNNLIDITSTTGVVGLITYLSIFIFVAWYLIRFFRSGRISQMQFCLVSALFFAYFVQNLVLFDSSTTYLCLMVLLGYVFYLINGEKTSEHYSKIYFLPLIIIPIFLLPSIGMWLAISLSLLSFVGWLIIFSKTKESFPQPAENLVGISSFNKKEIIVWIVGGLIAIFVIYQYSFLPYLMLQNVIKSEILFNQNDLPAAIAMAREAFKNNTPLDRDGRSIFIRSVTDQGDALSKMDPAQAEEILSFTTAMAEKNLALNPLDSMAQLEAARIYDTAFRITTDVAKENFYSKKALLAINNSIIASPGRVTLYFVEAQFLAERGQMDKALAVSEYAQSLNPDFFDSSCQLSEMYYLKAKTVTTSSRSSFEAKEYSNLDACLAGGGQNLLVLKSMVTEAIAHYDAKKDYQNLASLYEQLTAYDSQDPNIWINLAQLYARLGEKQKAIEAANQAVQINPELKADAQDFINQLGQ